MVSKLLNFDEKAKTFRLFESYTFDQSKLEIIHVRKICTLNQNCVIILLDRRHDLDSLGKTRRTTLLVFYFAESLIEIITWKFQKF